MRPCVFCGSLKNEMTREHVWGDWISWLFHPKRKPKQYTNRRTTKDGSVTTWKSASIDLRCRIVCQPCNNDWLSVLENDRIKPILSGPLFSRDDATFTRDQQLHIAQWAFKTAVVIEHMQPDRYRPFFPAAARRAFSKTQRIPEGVQVWITGHVGVTEKRRTAYFITYYLNPTSQLRKRFEYYVVTFIVGHFAFHLVAGRRRVKHAGAIPPLEMEPLLSQFTNYVWPIQCDTVTWPPSGKSLSNGAMDTFATYWAKMRL